jgi:hypothetical protein
MEDDDPALRGESVTARMVPTPRPGDAARVLGSSGATLMHRRAFAGTARWLRAASIAIAVAGVGALLWQANVPRSERVVVAAPPSGGERDDSPGRATPADERASASPRTTAPPAPSDSVVAESAGAPAVRGQPAPPRPQVPARSERADPRTATVTLAGLARASTAVDSSLGVVVRRDVYEIRPGVPVALEIAEAPEATATRGVGGAGRRTPDTSATVQVVDGTLALTWRDPSGLVLRLRGAVSEEELASLRQRTRVERATPP